MAFDIMDWLVGHSPKMKQTSKFTEPQQQFQEMLLSMLGGPTGQGMDWISQLLSGDEEAMKAFEAPAMRQFEQEVVPGIAERFAGMGTMGAGDSSAFQQTMGQAGKELSENLQQMRSGLKFNALQALQNFMNPAMAQGRENMYDPGSYGIAGGALQGIGQGAGQAAGMSMFL